MIEEAEKPKQADYRYLAKLIYPSFINAKKLLEGYRVDNGGRGTSAMYNIADMDRIAAEYHARFNPLKDNEWLIADIADHFGIALSAASRLAKHDNFPTHSRMCSLQRTSKAEKVWKQEEIEALKPVDFGFVTKKVKPPDLDGVKLDIFKFIKGDYSPRNFA